MRGGKTGRLNEGMEARIVIMNWFMLYAYVLSYDVNQTVSPNFSNELEKAITGVNFFLQKCTGLLYLWPFVGCGVFSLCNLLLSVSRAALLTFKKQTGQWLRPFLCLNCFTNTLEYYRKNYRFRKAQNWY